MIIHLLNVTCCAPNMIESSSLRTRITRIVAPELHETLAIEQASCEWIAFLDADDVYCERRFSHAHEILQNCPWADGIYDAVGVFFETDALETRWMESKQPILTTMTRVIAPEVLFEETAPVGNSGYWHLDGWLVRKSLLKNVGLFDEHLWLHQDTALCLKAAAIGKLVPGNIQTPVAMRRVHENNRITAERPVAMAYDVRCSMWATLWRDGVGRDCAGGVNAWFCSDGWISCVVLVAESVQLKVA